MKSFHQIVDQSKDIEGKDIVHVIVDTEGSDLAEQDNKDMEKGIRDLQHLHQTPIKGNFSKTSLLRPCIQADPSEIVVIGFDPTFWDVLFREGSF